MSLLHITLLKVKGLLKSKGNRAYSRVKMILIVFPFVSFLFYSPIFIRVSQKATKLVFHFSTN